MAVNIRKFLQGFGLIPVSTSTIDTKGELEVLDSSGKLQFHNGSTISPVVTEAHTATLTNKTIDADSNTISNIENADIKAAAAIDVNKLAALTVSRAVVSDGSGFISAATTTATEIGYVNGVTSSIQDQLDGKQAGGNYITALTGDVTASGPGSVAATIANEAVTLAKMADLAANSIIGNNTGSPDVPLALSVSQATAMLNNFVGDSGSGGTKGLVPAPSAGDAASLYVLKADGTWGVGGSVSPLTTKGDLYGYDTDNARIPVGTNGQKLVADSAQTLGLKWQSDNRTINAQTGTTYTFTLSDGSGAGNQPLVTASNASAQTYTVPPNSSVAFPVGTQIDITQLGAGLVTLEAGVGVTLNSLSGGLSMFGQYSAATLIKTATDVWEVYGTGENNAQLALSDWEAYTPTIVGLGSVTNVEFFSRRVGDSLQVRGRLTGGTYSSAPNTFTLPGTLTIDASKLPTDAGTSEATPIGWAQTSVANQLLPMLASTSVSTSLVYFGRTTNAATHLIPNVGQEITSGVEVRVDFSVPISGWTSTQSGTVTAPRSEIAVNTANGYGSTNDKIPRFTTIAKNVGSAITYADSSINGASFTIVDTGIYSISYTTAFTSGSDMGISLNSSELTTNIYSISNIEDRIALGSTSTSGFAMTVSVTLNLIAGDIIRPHTSGATLATAALSAFRITKVSN